ncbi:transglycosylase domain-containing protein [Hazenella sp. IB182357]|uniref:Transglycosylase domain-containing protein n=1 Tax=Polycladospora coralii TaxID=2771432 RepID=A0A926N820_9BACL|nr:transglycosylase domain-containing protein [Polycladospora coralii]MBD1370932.1 transglycosylase domain-containing protein [Polycladospora coralii]
MQNNESKSVQHPKRRGWRKVLKITTTILFTMFVLILCTAVGVVGVGAGLVSALTKDEKIRVKEDFEKELTGWSQTSSAYFTGKQPVKIGDMITFDERILIKDIDEVSPHLRNAFLAIEDREFYQHNGVNPRSLLRAAWQDFSDSDVSTGGSTITQQLIKNELLTKEKSYKRKAVEIVNSIRIEKYYEKETIFVAYMNSAYFGNGAHGKNMYGVKAAAKGIFNQSIDKMHLAQAAYIAGMVQRPNAYIPFGKDAENKLKLGLERQRLVLDQMLKYNKITKSEYDEAMAFDIKSSLAKRSDFPNGYEKYPFIIQAVENEAIEILSQLDDGKKDREDYRKQVRQGGYKIYTTIDQKMYEAINNADQSLRFPTKPIKGATRQEQVGAVMMENKTGAVLAFYAGPNFDQNQMDHAFEAKNQPGSAIKPLLVYGPAMEEGLLSSGSIIIDEPIMKAGTNKPYNNSGKKNYGRVTAAQALQHSYNIPVIKVFRRLGINKGYSYTSPMNITRHKNDYEAAALGGATVGYRVSDMTAAYAMIANNGMYNKPHTINKIVSHDGEIIYDFAKSHSPKKIFSPQTSYELTRMLRNVVTSGTGRRIGSQVSGYNVAGKTGTTTSKHDLWFVGYTPEVSMGVWSGYDYNTPGNQNLAKNAWTIFFKAAAKANPDLIKRGSQFKPQPSLPFRCFECNRVVKKEEPKDKKKEENRSNNP